MKLIFAAIFSDPFSLAVNVQSTAAPVADE
jgi:hypothetical protein